MAAEEKAHLLSRHVIGLHALPSDAFYTGCE
jgi:hypothetical protein